jgi:hypothetical protein
MNFQYLPHLDAIDSIDFDIVQNFWIDLYGVVHVVPQSSTGTVRANTAHDFLQYFNYVKLHVEKLFNDGELSTINFYKCLKTIEAIMHKVQSVPIASDSFRVELNNAIKKCENILK